MLAAQIMSLQASLLRHNNHQWDKKTTKLLNADQTFQTTITHQKIALYFDTDQLTNLATNKPTQEKIKHTPHDKINFCHRKNGTTCPTKAGFGFDLPAIQPSTKPKEPFFANAPKTLQTKQLIFVEPLLKIIFIKSLVIKNFDYFCSVITKE
jgi:hypothetical protein